MKTILEFDNDEQEVARLASDVVGLWSAIDDVKDKVRGHLKYGEKVTMDEIYQMLYEIGERYPLP